MSYNAGLLFYKHYYEGFDWKKTAIWVKKLKELPQYQDYRERDWKEIEKENNTYQEKYFQDKNKLLFRTKLPKNAYRYTGKKKLAGFSLTTTYPGLVLGTGYTHGSGLQGEFKVGFFFDYTTGLPVIPGSSVKGILRSFFPLQYQKAADEAAKKWERMPNDSARQIAKKRKKEQEIDVLRQHAQLRYGLLRSILQKLDIEWEATDAEIDRLERAIFDGILDPATAETGKGLLPMSHRDIFHDAVIEAAEGDILADDFITLHRNNQIERDGIPHELKNPTPIKLIKVMPEVTFRFQFKSSNQFQKHGLLTAKERRKLYEELLLLRGVGAKTNVGYGQFQRAEDLVTPPQYFTGQLRTGSVVEAKVIGRAGAMGLRLQLLIGGAGQEQEVDLRFPSGAKVGSRLQVKVIGFRSNKKKYVQSVSVKEWIERL